MPALALALAVILASWAPMAWAQGCEAYRMDRVITTPLEVSRFRATGIREPRVMEITYSPAYVPAPFRITDPAGAEPRRDALFEMVIDTGALLGPRDDRRDDLRLYVDAVDRYPLSSSIGRIGGRPGHMNELLTAPDGTRYHAWDGYQRTDHDLPGGFVGVAYPGAGPHAAGIDLWARFDAAGEATDVLQCNTMDRYPYPQCQLHQKVEPLFVRASFDRRRLDDLGLIADRSRDFTTCLMENLR